VHRVSFQIVLAVIAHYVLSYFKTVFVLSCDFIYFIYVICLGKLFIGEGDM